MKIAVWAIFINKLSILEKPQLGLCTGGNETWCKFKNSAIQDLHMNKSILYQMEFNQSSGTLLV